MPQNVRKLFILAVISSAAYCGQLCPMHYIVTGCQISQKLLATLQDFVHNHAYTLLSKDACSNSVSFAGKTLPKKSRAPELSKSAINGHGVSI